MDINISICNSTNIFSILALLIMFCATQKCNYILIKLLQFKSALKIDIFT